MNYCYSRFEYFRRMRPKTLAAGLGGSSDLLDLHPRGERLEALDPVRRDLAVDQVLDRRSAARPAPGVTNEMAMPSAPMRPGPADAVDVVLQVVRQVVVDDVRDAEHVDAAADHVGGDQDRDLAVAERLP